MEAITRKYGHKEGLTTKEGKITNWPYSEPNPTQKELDRLVAEFHKVQEIKSNIASIESQITSRRIREAVLGLDGGWLASKEAEIEQLRADLDSL